MPSRTETPRNPYKSRATGTKPQKAKHFVLKPGIPEPPNFVGADSEAYREWCRICALLDKEHRISPLFMASIATYCMKYADWVWARCKVQDNGRGAIMVGPKGEKREVRNPWLSYEKQTFSELQKAAHEIGITPMTSMKVEAIRQVDRGDKTHEEVQAESLDSFIEGNGRVN